MCVSKSKYQTSISWQQWPGPGPIGIHQPARLRAATTTAFRFSVPNCSKDFAKQNPGLTNPIAFQQMRRTRQRPADHVAQKTHRPEKALLRRRILQLTELGSTFATTTTTPKAVMIFLTDQAMQSSCLTCDLRIENKRMANFCQTASTLRCAKNRRKTRKIAPSFPAQVKR